MKKRPKYPRNPDVYRIEDQKISILDDPRLNMRSIYLNNVWLGPFQMYIMKYEGKPIGVGHREIYPCYENFLTIPMVFKKK